jgi:hypothetical protein
MIFSKIINHNYPLTIPKIEAIIFPADGTLLNFFGRVSQGASTAFSVGFFGFRIEVLNPYFVLIYDPVDQIWFILVVRQKLF